MQKIIFNLKILAKEGNVRPGLRRSSEARNKQAWISDEKTN